MVARMVARAVAGLVLGLALRAQPQRIVSTFPSITETLFAIGAGDRVVGVSNYCRYPPAALSLPRVGGYLKPDAEKIALLRPDMVILRKNTTGLADRLSDLGIAHAEVSIGSLSDVYSMIREVGIAAGAEDRAEKLNDQIRSRLAAFRAETLGHARVKVLVIVGRTPGMLTNLIAVGPAAYLGELLEIAGGENVLTEPAIAYPRISMETVVRADPEVILDLSAMSDAASEGNRLVREWLSHRELEAVRSERVFAIPPEPLATPGPRVVEAVELLRSTIHRDRP